MEKGVVRLANTKRYPFNDSAQTVALSAPFDDTDYLVLTEVLFADGEIGDVIVDNKAVNGFRIAFDGSAKRADIRYYVIL